MTTTTKAIWIVSGSCPTEDRCVMSTNYPSDYPGFDSCTISTDVNAPIIVEAFSTESYFDHLTVNGVRYSGTTGPSGVVPTGNLVWYTDSYGSRSGWRLCLDQETTLTGTITTTTRA